MRAIEKKFLFDKKIKIFSKRSFFMLLAKQCDPTVKPGQDGTLPEFLSIHCRCLPINLFKKLRIIIYIINSHVSGNFCYGRIGGQEHIQGSPYPFGIDIIREGLSYFFMKSPGQIVFVYI